MTPWRYHSIRYSRLPAMLQSENQLSIDLDDPLCEVIATLEAL